MGPWPGPSTKAHKELRTAKGPNRKPKDGKMEKREGDGGNAEYWWWAAASTGQLGWGISALRRGYAGSSNLMPVKAFFVASLFVGATASAAVASLLASGIHSVEDMKTVGASIRTGVGIPPRAQDN
nr:uncharacterized protein LOC109183076 [Ipomoea trifida]